MAASITGTFTIIDRASGPMRKMERQAKQTMAAIEGVGAAQDKTGSRRATANMEQYERQVRNVGTAHKGTSRDIDDTGRAMRRTEGQTRSLMQRIRTLGGTLIALRAVMRALFMGGIAVGITALVQAVGALGGGVAALLPMVMSLGGAMAGLPVAVGAAVQGMATLKLALSGVGDALKAGIKQQTMAGATAVQTARQHQQAADQIRSAERGLFLANRSAKDAQEALTQARREARRELVDLSMAAEGAVLSQQRAAISLQEARRNLTQTVANPQSTGTDVSSARLGVREAAFALRQSRIDRQRAIADNKTAQTAGVAGSDRVKQARRGLSDAIYGQTEATRALARAQQAANDQQEQGSSQAQAYQQALAQLSPEAQRFVRHLIAMRPVVQALKREAGADLFPGLTTALNRSQRLAPTIGRNLRRTGGVIGNQAAGLAGDLTTPGRIGDVNTLMVQNTKLVGQAGRGFRNLTSALLDFMVAARPFTSWMSTTIEGWTATIREQQRFNRFSGETAANLDRTRESMTIFGHILRNLWGVWKGFRDAAWETSEALWQGAEQATAGWNAYVNSVEGSARIKWWLDQLREPLHELGGLTKDLLRAWAHVTVDPNFTNTIVELRKAVPYLERFLVGASGMGPAAAQFLTQLIRLLSNLPFQPLTFLVSALAKLLELVNTLVEKIPGLGLVISGLVTAGMLGKMGKLLGQVKFLRLAWVGVRDAIMASALAQGALDMIPGRGGGRGRGRVPGGGGGRGGILKRIGGTALDFAPWIAGPAIWRGARGLPGRLRGRFGGGARGAGGWDAVEGWEARAARGPNIFQRAATRFPRGAGAARMAGRVAGPVGAASLIANAAGQENMDPLLFITGGKLGRSAESTKKSLKSIGDRSVQAALAGDTAQITKLRHELHLTQAETDGGAQAFDKMRAQLARAGEVARQTRDLGIARSWAGHFATLGRITRTDVRGILQQLDHLPSGSRRRVAKQMIAMTAELEAKGILPEGATVRLRRKLLGHLNGLEEGAKRRVRAMIRGMGQVLLSAWPTLKPLWDAVLRGTDPKKTGLSRRELARRVLNFGSTNPNAPGMGDQLLGPHNAQQRRQGRTVPMNATQLRRWQRNMGITPDAQVGPETRAAARRAGIIVKLVDDTNKQVRASHRQTKKAVTDVNDDIAKNTKSRYKTAADAAGGQARRAHGEVRDAFDKMRADTLKNLTMMGYSRSEARNILAGKKSASTNAPGANGQDRPHARGGRIRGTGLQDTVPVAPGNIAAPGELVVNRHTEQRQNAINAAVGAPPIGKLVDGENRPHSAAMNRALSGNFLRQHARGGRIVPIPGMPGESIYGPILPALEQIISKYHVLVTDGFSATGHATNSDHHWGGAVDLVPGAGGSWDMIDKLAAWAEPTQNNPRYPFRWVGYTGDAGHGRGNHLHLSWLRSAVGATLRGIGRGVGGLAGGGMAEHIKRRHSRMAGAPGAMSDAAMGAGARGLNMLLDAQGGVGGGMGGGLGTAGGQYNKNQIAKFWRQAGGNPKMANLAAAVALAESSGNAGVINSIGATGLWQVLQSAHPDWAHGGNLRDPLYNARAAVAISSNGRNWQPWEAYTNGNYRRFLQMGGRVADFAGWNAKGGRFSVNRPTLFGAGEAGEEDVTITPKGGGGAPGGRPVVVKIGKIENHREGDIKKHIKREFELLRDDLDLVGSAEED